MIESNPRESGVNTVVLTLNHRRSSSNIKLFLEEREGGRYPSDWGSPRRPRFGGGVEDSGEGQRRERHSKVDRSAPKWPVGRAKIEEAEKTIRKDAGLPKKKRKREGEMGYGRGSI